VDDMQDMKVEEEEEEGISTKDAALRGILPILGQLSSKEVLEKDKEGISLDYLMISY
jgi:hypothetical protein